jgi:alanine racemase
MTHLANADDVSDTTTTRQINVLREFTNNRSEPVSIANSAAILACKQSHSEWVRPGLMLYGVSPFPNRTGNNLGLRAAMTLQSRLLSIKQLHVGDAVGYGGDWLCQQSMRLGIVAIGYADGYPRSIKSGTMVLVNGIAAPIVGRVSMDMLTIDLSNCPEAKQADPVIIWGEQLAVEILAQSAATIAYTLLCGVTQRVGVVDV